MKRKFTVEVIRKQSTIVEVEAECEDEAMFAAEDEAANDASFDKAEVTYESFIVGV